MNTGNIGRLCLAAGAKLHLVEPLGFSLEDSKLKRAGLDYWKHVQLEIHPSVEAFFVKYGDQPLAFFSSRAGRSYVELKYTADQFLIFGKESKGLPEVLTMAERDRCYKIPILNEHVRSLNLANAASVVLYEGVRQLGF